MDQALGLNLKPLTLRFADEQVPPGHFFRLGQAEQEQERRRNISQDAIVAGKVCGVFRNVNDMDKISRMRGVRRTVGVSHQLTVAVVRSDQAFSIELK